MDLKFIYTDKNFKELGFLRNASLDLDISKYGVSSNDFELTMSCDDWDTDFNDGSIFYAVDTEWGGALHSKKVNTEKNEITFKGLTFRGLLEKEYVQPSNGEAYLILKDDANTCIKTMISGRFNGLYVVEGLSGIDVDYQVRDLNLLQALEKALEKANARLDIKVGADGKVRLNAVKINDLSNELQFDNSYQVNMIVETAPKPYNHILALGKGELTERQRANLYMQKDGSWSETEYYIGLDRKTYKYENVNAEDIETLKTEAIEKVEELNTTDTLEISFSADDANLFDIVGAKEQITGISFKQPITQKLLKGNLDNLSVQYKVGE